MNCQIGLIGLAVMGRNLSLNIEDKGFSVAVYNRTAETTKAFVESEAKGKNIIPTYSIAELVAVLERPRKILLMVKAGEAVDGVLQQLTGHLKAGDIVIDGGNSFFKDTDRRGEEATQKGILYVGTGISGGEEGALKGPCIMPGGPKKAYYDQLEPILTSIAAKVNGNPCCTYIGPKSAGHFVKMVHNGIEYGIMQSIAEAYHLLQDGLGLPLDEIQPIIRQWNEAPLNSYLMEITEGILGTIDKETNQPILDVILDKAAQKGTGKWTSQIAFDLGVPTPTINAAVTARIISAYKDERITASKILQGPSHNFEGNADVLIDQIHDALYASIITAYAQGFALLKAASKDYYDDKLNYTDIARIWKGGCIIRAKLLDTIQIAFEKTSNLANLLVEQCISGLLNNMQSNWRACVQTAIHLGIPCPSIAASLQYFDSYRLKRLPANLIQAQRDFFGAHSFERTDKDGEYHIQWQH